MNSYIDLPPDTLYQRLGGSTGLQAFVDSLYWYMDTLPEVKKLRDLHTVELEEAGVRLFRFLSGWLGGPPLYHRAHGEPRLRRRHLHVAIGERERDQWLLCARKALEDMPWPQDAARELMQRLEEMADHLRNRATLSIVPDH